VNVGEEGLGSVGPAEQQLGTPLTTQHVSPFRQHPPVESWQQNSPLLQQLSLLQT
jgi:hypothetical protein